MPGKQITIYNLQFLITYICVIPEKRRTNLIVCVKIKLNKIITTNWFYVFCKYRDHHIKNPCQRIFSLFWKRILKSSTTTALVARLDHRRSKVDQQDFCCLLEHVLRRENLWFLNLERKQCDRTLPFLVTQLTFFLLANGSVFLEKAKDPRMPRSRITVNSKRVILKNLLRRCV